MKNGSYFPGRGTLVEETFLKGKAEGKAEGQRRSILRLLEMRGIPVSDSQRARINGCTDPRTLDHWLERAFSATHADELFRGEPAAGQEDGR
ncbi:hypothetical protein ACH4RA_04505 [Streptomyces smyrnaeus]|uniref:hypothetical protein n=1 Tax=Streptomyces smyrnaeus TaxID=1387713 RepID=UPI0037A0BCDA